MKKIVIIGGWPAGLMTAASILRSAPSADIHITLLEWNKKLGQKLLISGGGRCNVTTGIFDIKLLATKYIRGFDFFKPLLGKFSPKKCKKWFEDEWLPLKIEEDMRVFPSSDNGDDVLGVFERIFREHSPKITIQLQHRVQEISKKDEKFYISTNNTIFEADILVIATWGNAYAHTGSRGDGYTFARSLGHSITPLGPSLSSFLIQESYLTDLSGISFHNANICVNEKKISWSLLCTHFGISGPLAFMLSSHLAWEDIRGKRIRFCPIAEMDTASWDHFLKQSFALHPKRKIGTILKEKLPWRFCDVYIEQFHAHIRDTFVGEISKKDRESVASMLGNGIEITLLERRPWDEFVTAGGVDTDEIHNETLESKICNNLYFVWEILNIDGYTGGFSLQICWSTGFVAGKSIAETAHSA